MKQIKWKKHRNGRNYAGIGWWGEMLSDTYMLGKNWAIGGDFMD